MNTNAAMFTNSPPVPSGDEFTAEEMSILNGETSTPAPEPSSAPPAAETAPPQPANDDMGDDFEEIETENPDQPRDDKGRFVPKSAYLRVKEEGKATNQKLATVAAELIRMREREAMLREMATATRPQPAEPEQEREISPEEDIFGAYKQLAAKLKRLEEGVGSVSQQTRAEIQAMQLQTAARVDLEGFAAKEPSFMEAYAYVVTQRDKELEAFGERDANRRQAIIRNEARELMEGALRSGQSAAERIWQIAQVRGYQPKPKAPANAPPIDPKAAEQIDRINKGKEASASLRGAGTTSDTVQPLTLAKLADMSENEYLRTRDAYVAKNGKAAWDRLTRGA